MLATAHRQWAWAIPHERQFNLPAESPVELRHKQTTGGHIDSNSKYLDSLVSTDWSSLSPLFLTTSSSCLKRRVLTLVNLNFNFSPSPPNLIFPQQNNTKIQFKSSENLLLSMSGICIMHCIIICLSYPQNHSKIYIQTNSRLLNCKRNLDTRTRQTINIWSLGLLYLQSAGRRRIILFCL